MHGWWTQVLVVPHVSESEEFSAWLEEDPHGRPCPLFFFEEKNDYSKRFDSYDGGVRNTVAT